MATRAEIIYAFDGYCGWCWGMEATMQRLAAAFAGRFDFSAICGGLMIGDRIGPLGDFADYIERAMPRVEQLTGAVFSPAHRALISNRQTMQNSHIPAAAFSLVTAEASTVNTMQLAHQILSLNFAQGADLSLPQSYAPLFTFYRLDAAPAVARLAAGEYAQQAEAQFARARQMGAEAFPTVIYGRDGSYFPLCQGFQTFENLSEALDILHREPPPL